MRMQLLPTGISCHLTTPPGSPGLVQVYSRTLGSVDAPDHTGDGVAGRIGETQLNVPALRCVDADFPQSAAQPIRFDEGAPHLPDRAVQQALEPEHGRVAIARERTV